MLVSLRRELGEQALVQHKLEHAVAAAGGDVQILRNPLGGEYHIGIEFIKAEQAQEVALLDTSFLGVLHRLIVGVAVMESDRGGEGAD